MDDKDLDTTPGDSPDESDTPVSKRGGAKARARAKPAPPRRDSVPFTFSRIRGQARAKVVLQGALASDRIAGAYLFYGEDGIGKFLAGMAMAAALNCDAPARVEGGLDACGACVPCRKVARLAHPDVHVALAVPAAFRKGSPPSIDFDKYRELLDSISGSRYYVVQFTRNATVSVDQIRGLIHEAGLTRVEGRRKVMVIARADRMNDSAANALLKTLEEPNAGLVIILTAPEPGRLLPTVASRCQHIRFDPLTSETIEAALVEDLGVESKSARHLSVLARGSLGRALEMREEDPIAFRDQVLSLLAPRERQSELLQDLHALVGWDQNAARRVAEVLILWQRDVLAVAHGLPEEDVLNSDRIDDLRAEAKRLDPAELRRRLAVLEDLVKTVNANVTPDLAVFSAIVRLEGRRGASAARA